MLRSVTYTSLWSRRKVGDIVWVYYALRKCFLADLFSKVRVCALKKGHKALPCVVESYSLFLWGRCRWCRILLFYTAIVWRRRWSDTVCMSFWLLFRVFPGFEVFFIAVFYSISRLVSILYGLSRLFFLLVCGRSWTNWCWYQPRERLLYSGNGVLPIACVTRNHCWFVFVRWVGFRFCILYHSTDFRF